MISLTAQERKVVLFLLAILFIGITLNYFSKINSKVEDFIEVSNRIHKIDINQAGVEELAQIKGISIRIG